MLVIHLSPIAIGHVHPGLWRRWSNEPSVIAGKSLTAQITARLTCRARGPTKLRGRDVCARPPPVRWAKPCGDRQGGLGAGSENCADNPPSAPLGIKANVPPRLWIM